MLLTDVRGRDFDTTFMYYGVQDIRSIDEHALRNHLWQARQKDRKKPINGRYCTPEELQEALTLDGDGSLAQLNNQFRNVQYIRSGDNLYWIYCMSSNNINNFRFIGDNLSPGFIEHIMKSNSFSLGYTHYIDDTGYVDLWYHPERLYAVTFEFLEDKLIDRRVYFRRFESDQVKMTGYTAHIFNSDRFVTIPLMTEKRYKELEEKYHGCLPWTFVIHMKGIDALYDMGTDSDMLYREEYKVDVGKSLRFDELEYKEMLEKLFNKN